MKLACSVEVVCHDVDLKARVALKTARPVFKARHSLLFWPNANTRDETTFGDDN